MSERPNNDFQCPICGAMRNAADCAPAESVREPLAVLIKERHPDWSNNRDICMYCLSRYGAEYVKASLQTHKDELARLESNVDNEPDEPNVLPPNVNEEFEESLTFGQRVADKVTEFGGSWAFIGIYILILALWVTTNTVTLIWRPFDPYPYIFLNLVLSALATFQGPIILMSQNRQDQKDRLRAEYDHQVNLLAEQEIRRLNAKIDQMMTSQWTRLLEIQQIQLDLMRLCNRGAVDISGKADKKP
jgi:uncharacterized membrane protein